MSDFSSTPEVVSRTPRTTQYSVPVEHYAPATVRQYVRRVGVELRHQRMSPIGVQTFQAFCLGLVQHRLWLAPLDLGNLPGYQQRLYEHLSAALVGNRLETTMDTFRKAFGAVDELYLQAANERYPKLINGWVDQSSFVRRAPGKDWARYHRKAPAWPAPYNPDANIKAAAAYRPLPRYGARLGSRAYA